MRVLIDWLGRARGHSLPGLFCSIAEPWSPVKKPSQISDKCHTSAEFYICMYMYTYIYI